MTLTLFHTAAVHHASFDALAARIAPKARLVHVVRPDWLTRAQAGIDDALRAEVQGAIAAAGGTTLCTCTSIGPIAEGAGAIRIDRPMMAQAAQHYGPITMAYCLASTEAPSRALLDADRTRAGHGAPVRMLFLGQHWPLFTSGQTQGFHGQIARAIAADLRQNPASCVVLAQASMTGAAEMLQGVGVPVLSSPERALRAALGL